MNDWAFCDVSGTKVQKALPLPLESVTPKQIDRA